MQVLASSQGDEAKSVLGLATSLVATGLFLELTCYTMHAEPECVMGCCAGRRSDHDKGCGPGACKPAWAACATHAMPMGATLSAQHCDRHTRRRLCCNNMCFMRWPLDNTQTILFVFAAPRRIRPMNAVANIQNRVGPIDPAVPKLRTHIARTPTRRRNAGELIISKIVFLWIGVKFRFLFNIDFGSSVAAALAHGRAEAASPAKGEQAAAHLGNGLTC